MYKLSERSRQRLVGVHADLIKVVERAIQLTDVDFTVGEGVRTAARQQKLIEQGKTKTLDSRHLTGHAVDLYALEGGKPCWRMDLYYPIALAMREASIDLNIPIVWGAFWGQLDNVTDLHGSVSAYVRRKQSEGGRPLIDGVHFELLKSKYPAKA